MSYQTEHTAGGNNNVVKSININVEQNDKIRIKERKTNDAEVEFPTEGKENTKAPVSGVYIRAKKIAEEVSKGLDELDLILKPFDEELCVLTERVTATEKWATLIAEDIKKCERNDMPLDELTELTEKRISLNETLTKAIEGRLEIENTRKEFNEKSSVIQEYRREEWMLSYCNKETKDKLLQRLSRYTKRRIANREYMDENFAHMGKNVNTVSENIKIIQSDAERLASKLPPHEKAAWASRLDICKDHSDKINTERLLRSKERWFGIQPKYWFVGQ